MAGDAFTCEPLGAVVVVGDEPGLPPDPVVVVVLVPLPAEPDPAEPNPVGPDPGRPVVSGLPGGAVVVVTPVVVPGAVVAVTGDVAAGDVVAGFGME